MSIPDCATHGTVAAWRCRKCQAALCQGCVVEETIKRKTLVFCRSCEARCLPIEVELNAAAPPPTMGELLQDAAVFPLTDPVLLFVGTLCFTALAMLSGVLIGGGVWALIGYGMYCALMMRVLSASADGAETMPDWPEMQSWWDGFIRPALMGLAAQVVCFLPAGLVMSLLPAGSFIQAAFGVVFAVVGFALVPIALMRVATTQSLLAFNPSVMVRGVAAMGAEYAIVVLTMLGVLVAASFLRLGLLTAPWVGGFASEAVGLYAMASVMRMLGLMYRRHVSALNWFSEAELGGAQGERL